MAIIIKGMSKEIRLSINWLRASKRVACFHCKKDVSQFKFLWMKPFLNILCGCPGYHYALNLICSDCNVYKEIAVGNDNHFIGYCPQCFL